MTPVSINELLSLIKRQSIKAFCCIGLIFCTAAEVKSQDCPGIRLDDTIRTCAGQSLVLKAAVLNPDRSPVIDLTWSPAAGLSDIHSLTPSVRLSGTSATYTLTLKSVSGPNLITNGDFSAGSIGFTSEYVQNTVSLIDEGTYAVGTDANFLHAAFASFGDHTSGNGKMLIVNGASVPNVSVWCQTIKVLPNTDYDFSTWGATCVNASPAVLQFSINGKLLAAPFTLPVTLGDWQQFHTTWNSGSNTTATICVTNQNTVATGNDFALDDFHFQQVCESKATVVVTGSFSPSKPAFDFEITADNCNHSAASFTNRSSAGNTAKYDWDFGDGTHFSGKTPPEHSYPKSGRYAVKLVMSGTDSCALTPYKDSVTKMISFAGIIAEVPKAFSPNGDGHNDVLFVRGDCISQIVFKVYNRWGQLVFSTTNINEGWDGKKDGVPQEADGYAYTLEAISPGGTTTIKNGSVLLIH